MAPKAARALSPSGFVLSSFLRHLIFRHFGMILSAVLSSPFPFSNPRCSDATLLVSSSFASFIGHIGGSRCRQRWPRYGLDLGDSMSGFSAAMFVGLGQIECSSCTTRAFRSRDARPSRAPCARPVGSRLRGTPSRETRAASGSPSPEASASGRSRRCRPAVGRRPSRPAWEGHPRTRRADRWSCPGQSGRASGRFIRHTDSAVGAVSV